MSADETCGRCGKPAEGFAAINDTRYCHGDDDTATCYMRQSWDNTRLGVPFASILAAYNRHLPPVRPVDGGNP